MVLTDEDFARANLKKTKTIEILDFTPENKVDTIYYDTPYYLEPEKDSDKAYALLCEALRQSKKIAVVHFVFHHHEHLGVLRLHENLIVLHQLRYQTEINNPKALHIPPLKADKKELEIALKLINELTEPFKATRYADTYTEEVKAIIRKKAKGERPVTTKEPKIRPTNIHDILGLLKSSLQEHKKRPRKAKAA